MNLPPTPVSHLCDSYGILLRRDAVLAGVNDNALARLVRQKVIVRLRQGAYCLRSIYLAADERERHLLRARAAMRQYFGELALSHGTSCLIQGGPDYGIDLGRVHVTHLVEGGGRREAGLVHHTGITRANDVRRHEGHWVTAPARAVLETAITDGVEAGLVQANHFLHVGMLTREGLEFQYDLQRFWPGSIVQHPVVHLADGRIESVGETRSDYCFFTQGLPRPVPQYVVEHPDGTVAARVDFAWPERRVIVEFDGAQKYHRFRKEGETIEEMVLREKKREELIRELTGWTVIRLIWADLATPIHTANRIRRAFALPAAA